jgi:hypothetical protein
MRYAACLATMIIGTSMVFDIARGEDNGKFSQNGLRGIGAISVSVLDPPEFLKSNGLDKTAIRTRVELRLRQNGIKIAKSARVLQIELNALENGVVVAWITDAKLTQVVTVSVTDEIALAATWEATRFGLCGQQRLRDSVDEALHAVCDQFINDYLAENEEAVLKKAR